MFIGLLVCAISVEISNVHPFSNSNNVTYISKKSISGLYLTSPMISSIPRFDKTRLSFFSMNFRKLANSLYNGAASNILHFSSCSFKDSVSPIRINSVDRLKYKPQSKRIEKKDTDLTMRDVLFDFCTSTNEDGGALYTNDCNVDLTDVEFVSCLALNAAGFYARHGRVTIQSSSFYRCSSRRDGGGLIARECELIMKQTYFVMNKADMKYGAFYQSYGYFHMTNVFVYENIALRGFAGATFEESTGQMGLCRFVENKSPIEEGGTAINVISTTDKLFIEFCTFGGGQSNYLRYRSDTQVWISENCFDTNPTDSKTEDLDPTSPINPNNAPRWLNNHYYGQCTPAPKLPPRFHKELFHHPESAPQIEWWKLYTALGIFIFLIGIMAFSVPAVFFPLYTSGATRKGESQNN